MPRSQILSALQLIVDSHVIVSVANRHGRIIYVNERFCEISKYTREELIGETYDMLRSGYHPHAFYDELWTTIRAGKTWKGEMQSKAKDGSLYWVQATINPIFDDQGEIAGYASIRSDITAQKHMLDKLHDNEQRAYATLQIAIDSIGSAISIVDPSGTIVFANKAQAEMYPEQTDIKRPGAHMREVVRRNNPGLTEEEIEAYIRRKLSADSTAQRQIADGRTVSIQRKIIPGGGFVSLHTDITDVVKNTQALERQAATLDLLKAIAVDANESADAMLTYATCLERICKFTGWDAGHLYLPSGGGPVRLDPSATWYFADEDRFAAFKTATERTSFDPGVGLPGRVFSSGDPDWLRDVTVDPNFPRANAARQSGIVGGAAFPVKVRDEVVAVLEFYATRPIEPSPRLEEILSHVCTQMGRVAERDRAEKNLMTRVAAELQRRDQRLLEQNQRFNAALENMTQGLCMFDANQNLIVCNERYLALYGLDPDLVKPGTTLSEIVQYRIANGLYAGATPQDYIDERQAWAHAASTERKIHVLSDGRSIAVSKRPLPGGGWVSTHEDISDRRRTEAMNQRLARIVEDSINEVFVFDPETYKFLQVNASACRNLGYSLTELKTMTPLDIKQGLTAEKFEALAAPLLSGKKDHIRFETVHRRKDGSLYDAEVLLQQIRSDDRPVFAAIVEDITERKKAEAALRESQELFSKAFQLSPFALSISDPDTGSYHDVNDTWSEMFGHTREEARASTAINLGIWADAQDRKAFLEDLVANGSLREYEARFRNKGGQTLDVLTYSEYVEVDGRPLLFMLVYDITERKKAEAALRESQELFSKAFRASPMAMAIVDPTTNVILDVNGSWINMLGFGREEAMGKTAAEIGCWADFQDRERFIDIINDEGSVKEFETRFLTKDGRIINVVSWGERVEVGGAQKLLFVTHDITERKRAEQALRDSEHRFKTLVETLNVVPWEFDPETMRFTYVGPQAATMFGYPLDDWYGEGFWTDIIHPDDRETAVRICSEATRRCQDHDFEYRFLTANGGEIWVRDVVAVISEDGKATGLRGIFIDISDRKYAERALRTSQQRFKDIAEVSSDWIWECDDQLRFTYLSERFVEVTGVPVGAILGKTRFEITRDAEADWETHRADLEARRPFRGFMYTFTHKDGSQRHWSISGRPIFDETGTFKGYRGTGADRTAEVEAEAELIRHRDHLQDLVKDATGELKAKADELRQSLEKEKELNELQRQFVSMASHEFRTPLAIIDSAAQRLQRRADVMDRNETLKRVEKIRGAVARMTQLMESTLIAARLEAGRPTINLASCNIGALLREICNRHQEIARNHVISRAVQDVPETILADANALEQVFTNLLSNAVKYAPDAPDIQVTALAEGDDVVVSVRDQGVGIDEDDLPKMFQRFFRARTSAGIAGTGIGLNLVKTMVELHEGTIEVDSKKGEGSLFTVRLPINGPAAAKKRKHQAA